MQYTVHSLIFKETSFYNIYASKCKDFLFKSNFIKFKFILQDVTCCSNQILLRRGRVALKRYKRGSCAKYVVQKIHINVYFTRQWLHYYCILLIKEEHVQIRSFFNFPVGLKNIMSLTTNINLLINKILKTHCTIVFSIAFNWSNV